MKKYRLTDETQKWCGHTLYRIEALRDFADVKKGDKGGWIEKEENLSHYGNAWVFENAKVYGNACIRKNAVVRGHTKISGDAWVRGNAEIKLIDNCFSVSGIGSRFDITTVFMCSDGVVRLTCGCFYGTVEEFEKAVENTHGDSKYGREYKAVIELIKIHFDLNEGEE